MMALPQPTSLKRSPDSYAALMYPGARLDRPRKISAAIWGCLFWTISKQSA